MESRELTEHEGPSGGEKESGAAAGAGAGAGASSEGMLLRNKGEVSETAEAALGRLRAEVVARAAELAAGARSAGDVVDLGRLRRRKAEIESLRALHRGIQDVAAEIGRIGAAAEAAHRAELAGLRAQLEAAQAPAPSSEGAARGAVAEKAPSAEGMARSTAAAAAGKSPGPRPARPLALPPAPSSEGMLRSNVAAVTIAPGVELPAIVLPPKMRARSEVEAAVMGSDLFFVPAWRQFAARVGGRLFHANIGQLYYGAPKPGQTPARVRACPRPACRAAGRGANGCAFYHDPEEFAGSADVRNFLAEGWLYSPAAAPTPRGSRHFGSLGDLAGDLASISVEDAALYVAQAGHDLICALVLDRLVLLGGA